MKNREMKLTQIFVNGEWHIADKAVSDEIERLEKEIEKLNESVAKDKAVFQEKLYDMVDLIAYNLNDEFNGGNCLKHPIDYYTTMKSGEPVFAFRDKVYNKIKNGILGYDSRGARPQMRVKTIFYAGERPSKITVADALKRTEAKENVR